MPKKITAAVLAGALVLAACSEDAVDDVASEFDETTDSFVADDVEQNAVELGTEAEAEMNTLAAEIQGSEASAIVERSWESDSFTRA